MKLIEIPNDIDRLDLGIQDKVALATIRKRSCIPNGALAKELGLSDSGVRTMLRRFKRQGLVLEFNVEGKRQFEVMVDDRGIRQRGRHKLTKNDAIEIRHKVTAEAPVGLAPEEQVQRKSSHYAQRLLSLHDAMVAINSSRMCGYYAVEFQQLIDQIESDAGLPNHAKTTLLKAARYFRDHQIAAGYAVDHLAKSRAVAVLKVLQGATPEQLGKIYDRIQAEKALGSKNGKALLDFGAAETISSAI